MAIKGFYRFNGNSNDAGSNVLNGTDSNMSYSATGGKLHGCAVFNGTTSSIEVANSSTPYNWGTSQDFTILGWLKMSKTGEQYVITKTTHSATAYPLEIRVFPSDPSIGFFRYNGSAAKDIYELVSATKWEFFAFVKTGNTIIAYINGYPSLNSTTDVTGTVTNAYNLIFGKRTSGSTLFYGGSLCEVMLEDRAWSIAQLKNKQASDLGFF